MLPGINGFEVLRRIRSVSKIPVLLLTVAAKTWIASWAWKSAPTIIFQAFNPRELVARIRAILRRAKPGNAANDVPEVLIVGDVELDPRPAVCCARPTGRSDVCRIQSVGSPAARGRASGDPRAAGECRARSQIYGV